MANLQLKSDNFTRARSLCHIFNDLAHNEGGIRVRFLTEIVVKSAITMQHSSGQISTIYGD